MPPRLQRHALIALSLLFVGWALGFIYHTSFVAIDGQRYFALFDDAMISMRYSWNLAHGHGLVWNPGERVEGYTNLSMVLIMTPANALLPKKWAVLSIQILGIFTLLGIAWLNRKIATKISGEHDPDHAAWVGLIAFAAPLVYYPLVYWVLLGMETGIMAVLLLFSIYAALSGERRWLILMALALGLAYWTRPESVLVSGVLLAYVYWTIRPRRAFFAGLIVLYALLPILQHLFRWGYYGEVFSNTYTLKATGMYLDERYRNGMGFTLIFIEEHALILLGVLAGGLLNPSRPKLLLIAMIFIPIAYQVFIGGEPWLYWRIMAPTVPLALLLFFHELLIFGRWITANLSPVGGQPGSAQRVALALALIGLIWGYKEANFRHAREQLLVDRPYLIREGNQMMNIAVELNATTTPDARLGVFWAGIIPYYTERYAIDFWGKSDPQVARRLPDLSGKSGWNGMHSVPGHNKYDLTYSIQQLQPTYVQAFFWGQQDLTAWSRDYYVTVQYQTIDLNFRKDDPAVKWELFGGE